MRERVIKELIPLTLHVKLPKQMLTSNNETQANHFIFLCHEGGGGIKQNHPFQQRKIISFETPSVMLSTGIYIFLPGILNVNGLIV